MCATESDPVHRAPEEATYDAVRRKFTCQRRPRDAEAVRELGCLLRIAVATQQSSIEFCRVEALQVHCSLVMPLCILNAGCGAIGFNMLPAVHRAYFPQIIPCYVTFSPTFTPCHFMWAYKRVPPQPKVGYDKGLFIWG